MNILFLDQFSDMGGAQRCLIDLLPAIRDRGWNIFAAAPGSGPLFAALQAQGAQVESIDCGPFSMGNKSFRDLLKFTAQTPRLARTISEIAARSRADLLYVNGPRLLPAGAQAAAGSSERPPVPLLFHCHSHLPQRYARWLAGRALQRAPAAVVACCRFAGEPLACYVPAARFRVVYNAAAGPCAEMQPGWQARRSGKNGRGLRIGVIGRIAPEKGQAEFIHAARLLSKSLPGGRFIVCGEALFSDTASQEYARKLRRLADGLPVDFLGWREDVVSVLENLDLLVVPSIREPATTRVILEAYAAGVPVVAFPSGGIPEIVEDGTTGFLVSPSTPQALAAKIRELIFDSGSRLESAASAGQNLWRDRFRLERYQQEMLEAIASAAG